MAFLPYPYDVLPDIAPIGAKYMLVISSRCLFFFGWVSDELLAPYTILQFILNLFLFNMNFPGNVVHASDVGSKI